MSEQDRERFESAYAETLYKIAMYASYLRGRDFRLRAVGKRIQDEIREGLLEERSDDTPEH